MLPVEALSALDRLPAREAMRRPLDPKARPERRVAGLLAGEDTTSLTIGDALFRWARVEPESFAEADVGNLRWTSELVGAAGRPPKRFSLGTEISRAAAGAGVGLINDLDFVGGSPVLALARAYVLQRLTAHLFAAQGCEAAMCGAEADPREIVLNGLQATVHDPHEAPPTVIDKVTLITQTVANTIGNLQFHPLLFPLLGLDAAALDGLLPGPGTLGSLLDNAGEVFFYANAAAQAGRILWQRDTASLMQVASLASSSVAGHVGHVAGKAAAIAMLGLTGSWMVVLAPVAAGFTGRVLAKNLARRLRYHWLCRREVEALKDAVRHHCFASRDAIVANIRTADVGMRRFRELRADAAAPIQDCIEDWLERGEHVQDFRQVHADRFHRAGSNPSILDPHGEDPVVAAQESLLLGGRAGLHPANVAATASNVLTSLTALQRKMRLAIV